VCVWVCVCDNGRRRCESCVFFASILQRTEHQSKRNNIMCAQTRYSSDLHIIMYIVIICTGTRPTGCKSFYCYAAYNNYNYYNIVLRNPRRHGWRRCINIIWYYDKITTRVHNIIFLLLLFYIIVFAAQIKSKIFSYLPAQHTY